MQTKIEYGANLDIRQAIRITFDLGFDGFDQADIRCDFGDRPLTRTQCCARLDRRSRTPDDLYHLVKIGHRNHEAKQDVRAIARLVQFELGAAGDHFLAEFDEALNDVAQVEHFRTPAANGEHVGREVGLRRSVSP